MICPFSGERCVLNDCPFYYGGCTLARLVRQLIDKLDGCGEDVSWIKLR